MPSAGNLKFDGRAGEVHTRQKPLVRCHPAGSLDAFPALLDIDPGLSSHARIITAFHAAAGRSWILSTTAPSFTAPSHTKPFAQLELSFCWPLPMCHCRN